MKFIFIRQIEPNGQLFPFAN